MTTSTQPLFLLPGLTGDPEDISGLAARLADLGIEAVCLAPAAHPAATVEAFSDAALAAIRERQSRGPYRLFGYSFGALVALAVAEKLVAAGEQVERMWLADPFYGRRWWPADAFAAAQVNRVQHHLGAIAKLSPGDAARELARCARSFTGRLSTRVARADAAPILEHDSCERRSAAAVTAWNPTRWSGPTTIIAASPGLEFGCDVVHLWRSLLPRMTVQRVAAGGHRDLMRSPAAIEAIAGLVQREMATPPAPRAAVVTRQRWLGAARVALDLSEAGFEVVALSPRGNAIGAMPFVAAALRLPLRTKSAAVRLAALAPDIVVPCDDAAAMMLHALAGEPTTDPTIKAMLARSLGGGDMDGLYSRNGVLAAAAAAGVACPPQAAVNTPEAAATFAAALGGRTVVKADGSWGGRGVVIADDPAAAATAAARLGRAPGTVRMLKRLLVDRDLPMLGNWLRRHRPAVSVQGFIAGREANIAVACWQGETLASVAVVVSETSHATGPATVVTVIDHAGMTQAARRLCAELKLSGLVGLDFMLDDDGRAWLIELNPRVTPSCHLSPIAGPRLIAALRQRLAIEDQAVTAPRPQPADAQIVLFPQGLIRRRGEQAAPGMQDIPWHAPALVEQGLASAAAHRPRGSRRRAG